MVSFSNTKAAFRHKSNSELRKSYWLFKLVSNNVLVEAGGKLLQLALAVRFPVKTLLKNNIFKQFCGGESIDDCNATISMLRNYDIGSILDYSVEGKEREEEFDNCFNETLKTIKLAKGNSNIPFCVFKVTGLIRSKLLEKLATQTTLTESEVIEWKKAYKRVYILCRTAKENSVQIFIDAEESWIQDAIDDVVTRMMVLFNKQNAIVFNTMQLYRIDRLAFIQDAIKKAKNGNYKIGFKLVRGAYMEQENLRADKQGYPSPIHSSKNNCDKDYNQAIKICIENIDHVSFCVATHNEESTMLLANLMQQHSISNNDPRIYLAQLYGMSNHISFNAALLNYNVAKYVPYGPVNEVIPYLIRRAQENTFIDGQAGRELSLITQEINRRKASK